MSRTRLINIWNQQTDWSAFWLVSNETDALDLANVVESDDTDVGLGVLLDALIKLLQHLRWVGAPEHGKLPHNPVSSVIVSGRFVVLTVHETVLHFSLAHNCHQQCQETCNREHEKCVGRKWLPPTRIPDKEPIRNGEGSRPPLPIVRWWEEEGTRVSRTSSC